MFAKNTGCREATRGTTAPACRKKALALQVTMLLAGVSFIGCAGAQTTSGSGDADASTTKKPVSLQAVTVTGSNIRSVDVADAQPVVTISAADIQKQGFATVGQLLQNVSSMSPPDLSRSAPGDLGPNQGGAFIDLRGLGAMRTLVLVDGQRIGAAHGGYTNINVIPTAIVDHIDILATGASAVYGSDAIAGVVNIITKKNFNGVQLDTFNGEYMPHSDGRQTQSSVTLGKSTDKFGIVLSLSYQNQSPVWADDRAFSAYPYTSQHPYYGLSSYDTQPQILNAPASFAGGGRLVLNPGGNPMNPADYHPIVLPTHGANGDITDPGDYTYNNNAGRRTMVLTADKTKNLYLDTHYKITDNITFKFNYGYNADYEYAKSGAPLFYSGMGANGAFPSLLSQYSYYNPLYGVQDLKIAQRLAQDGYRSYNDPKNYRYSFGVDGVFSLGTRDFNWDVYMYDSKISGVNVRTGYFNLINVANGLGPSFLQNGTVVCGTPGHVIAGCVPINPLAPLTPQMLNYIAIDSVEHYGSNERAWAADFGGNLLELPGGDLTFSTGITHRDESGYDSPDPFAYAGYSTDGGVGPNSGAYNLNEAYAEINAPLLKNLPGAQSLSVDIATRYSHYSNFGSTTNSSFKLTWKPIDDVLVRASYGTGFRAPTVNDLYQGRYPAGTFTDPCDAVYGPAAYGQSALVAQRCLSGYGGIAGVPANFRQTDNTGLPITAPSGEGYQPSTNWTGGNPNLRPETSYNGDVGLVYSPSWLPGFDATIDWWTYNIRNLITGISNDQLLADCYQYSLTATCGQFKRDAATGQIIDLLNLETNAGWLKERGYDFAFNYRFAQTRLGNFKLGMNGTYITAFNMLPTVGSNIVYMAGNTQNFYSSWRLRGNLTLSWSWHDFGASWTARYFSPYKANCAFDPSLGNTAFPCTLPNYYAPGVGVMPQTQIPSITFNDLQVYWNAPWNATISLGANDLFNRVSPNVYGGYASGDTPFDFNSSYDLGRFVYMRYQQRF